MLAEISLDVKSMIGSVVPAACNCCRRSPSLVFFCRWERMKNASLLRSEELNRGYHIIDMRLLPSKRGLIGWSVTFPSNIKDKLFFLFDTKTIDCPSVGPSSQLMSAETLENASLASRVF